MEVQKSEEEENQGFNLNENDFEFILDTWLIFKHQKVTLCKLKLGRNDGN